MAKFFVGIPDVIAADKALTPADKLVYGAMLTFQGQHYHCFAARSTIATRCGLSIASVARAIVNLHRHGCIEPVMVHSERKGKVISFQQRGGKEGGKTKCWRCLVLRKNAQRTGISRVK